MLSSLPVPGSVPFAASGRPGQGARSARAAAPQASWTRLSGSGSSGSRGWEGGGGAVRCSGAGAFLMAGRWPATGRPGIRQGGSQAYLGPRAGAFMLAAR